jgi:hypothetical protein
LDGGKLLAVTVYRRGAVEVGAALAEARRAAAWNTLKGAAA